MEYSGKWSIFQRSENVLLIFTIIYLAFDFIYDSHYYSTLLDLHVWQWWWGTVYSSQGDIQQWRWQWRWYGHSNHRAHPYWWTWWGSITRSKNVGKQRYVFVMCIPQYLNSAFYLFFMSFLHHILHFPPIVLGYYEERDATDNKDSVEKE